MLSVKDLFGNEEPLVDFKEYTRVRKINGEKTNSMTIVPSDNNEHSFPLIEEESTIVHGDDNYIIKKMNERVVGDKSIKRVEGIHKFYVDLINKQQPKIHNGSITFNGYMNLVFEGTGYTFVVIDSFGSQEFDNLGNDNRLSLLSKGLERFEAEMQLVGNQVQFKKQIGNDTDFQFRYAHNIKALERSVDTTNLTTIIHGKWEDGTELTYRSPNADIFGEIEAPLFTDERYTTNATRLEAMKKSLNDTPEFSLTIDFVDLRAAGYPYTIPNEGDRVFVIYEPLNDLLLESRIMEITEKFDADLNPIQTSVTLSNYKKTFAGTMFANVQKQLRKITNEDGMVRYDVLDEAVRMATESLQNVMTELSIPENGGWLARDKNDPNKLVLFNAAGIGISDDGGKTFKTAMTGDGFVADVITAGILRGIILQGNEVYGGLFETSDPDFGTTRIQNGTITQTGTHGSTKINRGIIDLINGSRKTNISSADIHLASSAGNAMNIEIIPEDATFNPGQRQITGVDYLEVKDIRVLGEITYAMQLSGNETLAAQSLTTQSTNTEETNDLIAEVEELKKRVEKLESAI